MPRLPVLLAAAALAAGCGAAGCGGDGNGEGAPATPSPSPGAGPVRDEAPATATGAAAPPAAAPGFATKNTTRVAAGDEVALAAGVALAVHPARSPETRPAAVVLADRADWRGAISAAQLAGAPVRAPVLLSDGPTLPEVTAAALRDLAPTGIRALGGAQVVRVGAAAEPEGYVTREVAGGDPAAVAAALARLAGRAGLPEPEGAVIASADTPGFAMPAAGWAAKSGEPVLWVTREEVPAATRRVLRGLDRPRIRVLGPPAAISARVLRRLGRLGDASRVQGGEPVAAAIAFARLDDGWNVVDPGHGLVFAPADAPAAAAAAAPLSASGSYAPLLLVQRGQPLPEAVREYLLDIRPGYETDPVRGVYNHGWLMGDQQAISLDVQAAVDALLEIQPVDTAGEG